jgi:hypothetical protein
MGIGVGDAVCVLAGERSMLVRRLVATGLRTPVRRRNAREHWAFRTDWHVTGSKARAATGGHENAW